MASYSTMAKLKAAINRKLEDVIEELTQEIYQQLMVIIEYDIYDESNYSPSVYERTHEFADKAWDIEIKNLSKNIVGKIFYNPDNLTVDVQKAQHINAKELASILNDVRGRHDADWQFGRGYILDGEKPLPSSGHFVEFNGAFFDDTLNWLNENWHRMAKNALISHGFNIK